MGRKTFYVLSGSNRPENPPEKTFSEGLAELLARRGASPEIEVVVSSDVIGPTWFPEAVDVELTEGLKKAPPLPLREAIEMASNVSVPASEWLDPRWGLSERACRLLTDIGFVRQAPVLNILNGFEIAMRSIVASAGKTNSNIDNVLRAENQVSRQELAVGRVRRCVALMCYSLIDTFVWKDRMIRAGGAPGIQAGVNYRDLASLVKRRCDAFLRGEELTTSGRTTALMSLTTFISLLSSGGLRGTKTALKGTFYEVILGGHSTSLQSVVAAEYNNLLSATDEAEKRGFFSGMGQGHLEKMVNGEVVERASEDEKKWANLEQVRRRGRTADMASAEKAVPLAVTIRPTLIKRVNGEVGFDTGSLECLYEATANGTVPFTSLASTRKVLHSNFDVSYNPYFSFYALWNWMFLATGSLYNSPSNPMTKNLLVAVLTKDMHAILLCPRCHEGFVAKNEETCRLLDYTKEGLSRLKMDLRDVLYAMTLRSPNDASENELFEKIITHEDPRSVAQLDNNLKNMSETPRKVYAIRAIGASRGMAAIGMYSLLSSVKTEGLHDNDIEQVQLLNRWSISKNVVYLITDSKRDTAVADRDRATKAFIGIWALRNAVRLRRDVTDPTNYETLTLPSAPVPLSSVLKQKTRFVSDAFIGSPYVADFKNQFVEVLSEFKDDLICAKRGEKRRYSSDYYKFGERLKADRTVEPIGTYKLRDRMKGSSLELVDGTNSNTTAADNPAVVLGEVALPKEALDSLSKKTYTNLEIFPVTAYDI